MRSYGGKLDTDLEGHAMLFIQHELSLGFKFVLLVNLLYISSNFLISFEENQDSLTQLAFCSFI